MRAAPLVAAALIAPAAWGQAALDAARPPERPAEAAAGPQPSPDAAERPPPAQPSGVAAAQTGAEDAPAAPAPDDDCGLTGVASITDPQYSVQPEVPSV